MVYSNPPALEEEANSVTVENNLKAMRKAREAFIQSESSEKIKRALRHNLRSSNNSYFEQGDKVYYKRNGSPRWKGPATVLGQDHKTILLRHGGEYVRVHQSSIMPVKNDQYQKDCNKGCEERNSSDNRAICSPNNEERHEVIPPKSITVNSESEDESDIVDPVPEDGIRSTADSSKVLVRNKQHHDITHPKLNTKIKYRLLNSEVYKDGRVHSRSGKATGKYKHCFNIQDPQSGNMESIDFEREVSDWQANDEEQTTNEVLITSVQDFRAVKSAKIQELKNWSVNDVFEEVPDEGQHAITTRWIVTTKTNNGEEVTKARLVARGFEDENVNGHATRPLARKNHYEL